MSERDVIAEAKAVLAAAEAWDANRGRASDLERAALSALLDLAEMAQHVPNAEPRDLPARVAYLEEALDRALAALREVLP